MVNHARIHKVYKDPAGFGSLKQALSDAIEIDNIINLDCVLKLAVVSSCVV